MRIGWFLLLLHCIAVTSFQVSLSPSTRISSFQSHRTRPLNVAVASPLINHKTGYNHLPHRNVNVGLQMLFSVPDLGNLLFAPSDQRFFNPIWYPYFARSTHVEKLQIPPSRNPFQRVEQSDIWMFEQPIGFLNITVNIRLVPPVPKATIANIVSRIRCNARSLPLTASRPPRAA